MQEMLWENILRKAVEHVDEEPFAAVRRNTRERKSK